MTESTQLNGSLPGLRRISIYTRGTKTGTQAKGLDREALKPLVDHNSPGSAVFVCGPLKMMIQVKADLKSLGFPARSIFTEVLGFLAPHSGTIITG